MGIVVSISKLAELAASAESRWPAPKPAGPAAGADVEDLIHLRGPLTEDAVVRALQARFYHNKFYVSALHLMIISCSNVLLTLF